MCLGARNMIEFCEMGLSASLCLAPSPVAARPCKYSTNNLILSLSLRVTEGSCGYCTSWPRAGFACPSARAASLGSPHDEESSFSPPGEVLSLRPPKALLQHGLVLFPVRWVLQWRTSLE